MTLVIVILSSLISLAGIPKEFIASYSFTVAMLPSVNRHTHTHRPAGLFFLYFTSPFKTSYAKRSSFLHHWLHMKVPEQLAERLSRDSPEALKGKEKEREGGNTSATVIGCRLMNLFADFGCFSGSRPHRYGMEIDCMFVEMSLVRPIPRTGGRGVAIRGRSVLSTSFFSHLTNDRWLAIPFNGSGETERERERLGPSRVDDFSFSQHGEFLPSG